MSTPHFPEITDEQFKTEVEDSPMPVVVDFSATWCGPCKMQVPILEKLAAETVGKYKFVKVDIDNAPAIARRFGVQSVPTLMVFKKGEKTADHLGLANRATVLSMIEETT